MGLFDFLFGNKKKERERQEREASEAKRRAEEQRRQAEANTKKRKAYLVVFSTDWCGPSKRFLKDIQAAGINCFTVVDAEKNDVMSEKYSIRSVPTTLLLAADGVEIKRWTGHDDEDPGQSKFVNYIKSSFYDIRPFVESSTYTALKLEQQRRDQQEKEAEAKRKAEEQRQQEEARRRAEEQRKRQEQTRHNTERVSSLPSGIIEDNRTVFYSLENIKHRRMGEDLMLSPYDGGAFMQLPDASILPALAGTEKIKRFLPGMDFSSEDAAKKTLMGFVLKTESQMGVTYVIRFKNIPIGMVFVNTPLYNKNAINLAIWTIDFYIAKTFEHQGIMFNSILRVLNEMKTAMGAKNVYAMVDQDNADCVKVLGQGLFNKIDNSGFRSRNSKEKPPFVYVIDLQTIRFERR